MTNKSKEGVVIFAYHDVGVNGIRLLVKHKVNIHLVVTHKDDPNENIWFESVADICRKYKIKFYFDDDIDITQILTCYKITTIFSFYYRKIISNKVMALAKYGAINLHGSLLPKYRGRSPINWQLINGETRGGATLHFMNCKPDEGDIIDQERFFISKKDDVLSLFSKLIIASSELLNRNLIKILNGKSKRKKQNNSLSSYFGARKPEDGLIDWSCNSTKIYNLIRALTKPFPGAFTFYKKKKFIIWRSFEVSKIHFDFNQDMGTFLNFENKIYVKTGKGILKIDKFVYNDFEYDTKTNINTIFKKNCIKKFDTR